MIQNFNFILTQFYCDATEGILNYSESINKQKYYRLKTIKCSLLLYAINTKVYMTVKFGTDNLKTKNKIEQQKLA